MIPQRTPMSPATEAFANVHDLYPGLRQAAQSGLTVINT
jgi:hypothetical protein